MFYDYIVGERLSNHHIKKIYFERREHDEGVSARERYQNLAKAISDALSYSTYFSMRDECSQILSEFENRVLSSDFNEQEEMNAQDCLEALSYYGLEAYCLERLDLTIGDVDDSLVVRGYIIDARNEYHRLASAVSVATADITKGSTSDIVMEAVRSKIRFNPNVEEVIGIDDSVRKWENLIEANSGFEFDSTEILRFLNNRGYKVTVLLS